MVPQARRIGILADPNYVAMLRQVGRSTRLATIAASVGVRRRDLIPV